jgi:predicted TIM-barrel fold metal-dependent hydrolase
MTTATGDLDSIGTRNAWRLETPGVEGWPRTARPGDPHKYLLVSADCHVMESMAIFERVEVEYRDRIPRFEERADGGLYLVSEGNRPQQVRAPSKPAATEAPVLPSRVEAEDRRRMMSGRSVEQRIADQAADGIDAEIVFPTVGLLCWATPDPVFAMAMCRSWNRWAFDEMGDHMRGSHARILPMALIASGDLDGALREIRWAAEQGFRGVCLGNAPVYGPTESGSLQYNDPKFDPMWSLLAETGLVITFHVSTGRDPRASGGNGGAVINYVCHSMQTTIEPLVQLIASGVFARHPELRAGLVESGIGFVPWLLETMDFAARAHHMWVRPDLPELPSTYFRRNCFATFQEDQVGLALAEQLGIVDNLMWANDYPHHEGCWPHSAAAIERTMGHLTDSSRAKILGRNAAHVFGIDGGNR